MNEVALSYTEKDLLTFFQKVRLEKAKKLGDAKAGRNFENKEGASFSETMSNFGRFLKRNLKSADTVKDDANKELDKFNSKMTESFQKMRPKKKLKDSLKLMNMV